MLLKDAAMGVGRFMPQQHIKRTTQYDLETKNSKHKTNKMKEDKNNQRQYNTGLLGTMQLVVRLLVC